MTSALADLAGRLVDRVVDRRDRPAGRAARPRPAPRGRPRLVPARPDGRLRRLRRPVRRHAGRACGERLDYLAELGVTYLHLMPLLQPREGDNDGGYAVVDYRAVDPRLGTMDDLEALAADAARARHVPVRRPGAQPHRARAPVGPAAAGRRPGVPRTSTWSSPTARCPTRYERDAARGLPRQRARQLHPRRRASAGCGRRSTSYQWDLDWANPEVFAAMLDTMLALANRGIDVLRLDAVAVPVEARWAPTARTSPRRTCSLQALRALTRLAAPGVAVQGRGDRRARRARAVPRRARPATGPSATWPTTTS